MSALLFLSEEDFSVAQGQKGNLLCNNLNGYSIVLFYSTQCVHCHTLVPIFKSLVGTITNCQFGMINVSQQKRVVALSQNTITAIRYVPYIVFYVKGRPFMKYNGPPEASEIRRFITEITRTLQTRQKFYEETTTKRDTDKEIPPYTIGIPKTCDDNGVCYLEFEDAYKK
jgi:thiol-disulfide isomerase/thioredoxin